MRRIIFLIALAFTSVLAFSQVNGYFNYGQDGHVYFYLENRTPYPHNTTLIIKNVPKQETIKEIVTIWSGNIFYYGPNYNWVWAKGETVTAIDAVGHSATWICPYNDPDVQRMYGGHNGYSQNYNNSNTITGNIAYGNNANNNNYNESILSRSRIPGGYAISPFPMVDPELDKMQKEEYYKSIAKNYAVNGREKVPTPIPTKPLATSNDFPAQTNRYETNDHLKIITIEIKRYNNYQKAYVKVSDVFGPDHCEWNFMICADGTLLEDDSEYTVFRNCKNLNFTLKLNKGYKTITYNGQTLNKVSQETLQMQANTQAENYKIWHEIFMMNYNSQTSSGTNTQQKKSPERRSSTSCGACGGKKFETTPYTYAPTSTSGWAQPLHIKSGDGCSLCTWTKEHYHYPCPSCKGFGHN